MSQHRYATAIARISSGKLSRNELQQLSRNAKSKLAAGDENAESVLAAISQASCIDTEYIFFGFCPDANIDQRQDLVWRAAKHCTFDFFESQTQTDRFQRICRDDLIILKKRQDFGVTMRLYGHGRALSSARLENGLAVIDVDWSPQNNVIEVPLMGCNSTIDVRSLNTLQDKDMPDEFFDWLK